MRMLLRCAVSTVMVIAMCGILYSQAPTAANQTARPTPPTRDPHTAGYVKAKELPDGEVPPPDKDGNFIIGPTHPPAGEMQGSDPKSELRGQVVEFTMSSAK